MLIGQAVLIKVHVALMAISLTLAAHQVAFSQPVGLVQEGAQAAESADFYRADKVQTVHLQVAEADLKRMLAALPERIYVRASFQWRDITIDNVAVRFKGNSSSSPKQKHKRGYLIKFDEYTDGQQFVGLNRVSFDNGVQFGSVFSEPIITEILHDQGIVTHRCNYARLFLNDEYQGVYVNVERIDECFLKRRLPDPNGLLFKVDEGGPGGNLQFLGDNPAAYARTFEPETKAAKRGQRQLVEFIRLINQSPRQGFAATLDAKMETDDFLRVAAVMLYSGAFDQLTGWNTHNYYLYYDGIRERWRYLPWDLDVGFSETAFDRIHVLADWNAAWPLAGQQPNPLMERILDDRDLLRRYRELAQTILDQHFAPDRLCATIDAKYALIKDDLKTDPFPHGRVTNREDQSYEDLVASMKAFVHKRYASASHQLKTPGQRPRIVHRQPGLPPQIAEKLQRLQRRAESMRENGEDVEPIQKLMQKLGPLLEQGKAQEAERLIAEALKLTGETTDSRSD